MEQGKDQQQGLSAVANRPILATQLTIPPLRPQLIPRPRLMHFLNQVQHNRLTLISAPAGFGKTTLLSQWLADPSAQALRGRVGWVALESHLDPTLFWLYLLSALETVQAGVAQKALGLIENTHPQIQTAITVLINDITGTGAEFILILDDYDAIEDPEVHNNLAFFLEHLPPNLHLVIASRVDPPLPLARLRLHGEMAELRAADLMFIPDEINDFFHQRLGQRLPPEDLTALQERTEGWAAGLQAASLAIQGMRVTQNHETPPKPASLSPESMHDFIQAFTGSQRYILDYLVEEVLQRLPEHIRSFLLNTSILDRLSGPLCDAVTGREDSQSILEQLEGANVFLIPLDEERGWYRYHRLFADVLRHQLQVADASGGSEDHGNNNHGRENHLRASRWYEQHGMLDQAIEHALAAGAYSRAEDLLEPSIGPIIDQQGRLHQVAQWLEALPSEHRRAHPQLNLWYALVLLLIGRVPYYEDPLHEAEAAWREAQDPVGLARVTSLRAHAACRRGDFPQTLTEAGIALEKLPEDEHLLRSMTQYAFGIACRAMGDVTGAAQAIEAARQTSALSGSVIINLLAATAAGNLQVTQGQLRRAAATYREVIQKVGNRTFHPRIEAGIQLGELYREWNELDSAEHILRESIVLAEQTGWDPYLAQGLLALARVISALEHPPAAQAPDAEIENLLEQATAIGEKLGRQGFLRQVEVFRVRRSIANGNLAAVTQWAAGRGFTTGDEIAFEQGSGYITWARALIAQGKAGDAIQFLDRLRATAQAAGWGGVLVEILALQALAYQAAGNLDLAMDRLGEALLRAEPEGYMRTFLDMGAPMAALIHLASMRGIAPGYTGRLLASFKEEHALDASNLVPVTAALVEPLSERELEIVRLLARGASNQEIAQQLSIALTTAKKHVSNIIGKLGVSNRAQVAARARDLGLLF